MADDSWSGLGREIDAFNAALGRSKAVNVNRKDLRDAARQIVQSYFREVRPELIATGFSADELEAFDAEMQVLLVLTQAPNAKRSYSSTLRRIRQMRGAIATQLEVRLGERRSAPVAGPDASESRIIEILRGLVPSAAASYEQAITDLAGGRVSYRGTAVELREALRETLDHLAPDDAVENSPGFKLEKDRDRPTQKQKMRYVLRSRDMSSGARAAPEGNVQLIEELTGSLTRDTYRRGSLATHVAPAEGEIRQLKMYVDSVLAELLEIHAA